MTSVKKILIISSDRNLKDVLNFCLDGWGYEVFLQDSSRQQDIEPIKKISPDAIVIDVQSARKDQLNICRLLKDNFATAFIPVITLINKRQLRAQLLNLKQGVDDYLIKPPDPLDLRIRIEMVIRRSQHSIHASPLTGLPGGKILEDVLREKLKGGGQFSFGYLDIDNFKYFNDVYGYQRGDRVILHTAYMLFNTLRQFGNADDFISHIGGDDFAFISTPDKYEKICRNFIQTFDNVVPFHYSPQDRGQGFLMARDRSRKIKRIPLMSVSIAVVNKDASVVLKNTIQINERIAEIKRYLKTLPVSKFMADRRDVKLAKYKKPQINEKNDNHKAYKPLGQILLEKNIVSYEQLDEALTIHWKKGVVLGEMLKELGFINDESLQQALLTQETNLSYSVLKN
ncbi:MAG: diguanylate cyclase [Omnitrophica bacterium]|nr:diguanylate cyclase [Candidatus Omnitrophota bacterium]